MILLSLGILLFVGIHSTSVVGLRDRAVAAMGEGPWKGLYSLVSLVGLALIVIGYGQARQAPTVVWVPPLGLRHVTLLVMLPVFPLLSAAYLPGRIQRTVRHPMLVGTILWGLAHLLANGMVHDLVLFGGILGWAALDLTSMGWRTPREVPGAPPSRYNDMIAIVMGLVFYGAFLGGLHAWLIGVSIL